MSNLYDSLFRTLGQSESSDDWAIVFALLGRPSRVRSSHPHPYKHFEYDDLGIFITYNTHSEIFCSFLFQFDESVPQHIFHNNIGTADTRDDVELKMGIKPFFKSAIERSCGESKGSVWEKYDLPPYRYVFSFFGDAFVLTLASVDFIIDQKN